MIAQDAAINGLDVSDYGAPVSVPAAKVAPATEPVVQATLPAKAADAVDDVEVLTNDRFVAQRQAEVERLAYEKTLKEREAKVAAEEARLNAPKSLNDKLKMLGFDNIEALLSEFAATGGDAPKGDPKIEALQGAVQELLQRDKQREQQMQQETRQRAQIGLQNDIANFVKATPELELLQEPGGVEAVYNVMEQHYNNTKGQVLPIEVAARFVNKGYLAQAERLAKYNVMRKLAGAAAAGAELPTPRTGSDQVPASVTANTPTIGATTTSRTSPPREQTDDDLFSQVVADMKSQMHRA